jgi:hypothetical protein
LIDTPAPSKSQIDWRMIYHRLIVDLQWTPQQIGQLTCCVPSQLLLLHEKDPTVATYTPSEAAAILLPRIAAERAKWEV